MSCFGGSQQSNCYSYLPSKLKNWIANYIVHSHSTDFDVHQNWLNITSSLPISEWYFDEKSQWTLDYPPFFAYFEYALSLIWNIAASHKVPFELFHRISVILSDLLLVYAVNQITFSTKTPNARNKLNMLRFILLANCGLLLVDHIHFQYNGFLLGFLVLSFDAAKKVI